MKIKLSIVIVNYNHEYFIQKVVETLKKSTTDFLFEIIVVDNHSHDLISLQFLRNAQEDKRLTLIEPSKNIEFGRANNLAVLAASF